MSLEDYGIYPNTDVYSQRLGFVDYHDYLHSQGWKEIIERILKRDAYKCVRCDITATEVHHRAYTFQVMCGQDDSNLVALCRECHDHIHYDENGSKRSDSEWEQVLGEKYVRVPISVGGKSFRVVRIVAWRRRAQWN